MHMSKGGCFTDNLYVAILETIAGASKFGSLGIGDCSQNPPKDPFATFSVNTKYNENQGGTISGGNPCWCPRCHLGTWSSGTNNYLNCVETSEFFVSKYGNIHILSSKRATGSNSYNSNDSCGGGENNSDYINSSSTAYVDECERVKYVDIGGGQGGCAPNGVWGCAPYMSCVENECGCTEARCDTKAVVEEPFCMGGRLGAPLICFSPGSAYSFSAISKLANPITDSEVYGVVRDAANKKHQIKMKNEGDMNSENCELEFCEDAPGERNEHSCWGFVGPSINISSNGMDQENFPKTFHIAEFQIAAVQEEFLRKYKNVGGSVYFYTSPSGEDPCCTSCGGDECFDGEIITKIPFSLSSSSKTFKKGMISSYLTKITNDQFPLGKSFNSCIKIERTELI